MRRWISILAAEEFVGVAFDKPDRRGREANLDCIEVIGPRAPLGGEAA